MNDPTMQELCAKVRAGIEARRHSTRMGKPQPSPIVDGCIRMKIEITKADGTVYTVTWQHGIAHCTCRGFIHRRTCRHIPIITAAATTEMQSGKKRKATGMKGKAPADQTPKNGSVAP